MGRLETFIVWLLGAAFMWGAMTILTWSPGFSSEHPAMSRQEECRQAGNVVWLDRQGAYAGCLVRPLDLPSTTALKGALE